MRVHALVALACALGCAAKPAIEPAPPAEAARPAATRAPPKRPDAAARLLASERSLIEDDLSMRFTVRSGGALHSRFIGSLVLQGERVVLKASGTFGETPVELDFTADGTRLRGTGGARGFDLPQPAGFREAFAVSLIRMGILHALAMLVAGRPPEQPEGDVRDWLVLSVDPGAPTVAVMDPVQTPLPSSPITFRTAVAGSDSLTATIWLDGDRLMERQQETRFPVGTMTVVESFEPI